MAFASTDGLQPRHAVARHFLVTGDTGQATRGNVSSVEEMDAADDTLASGVCTSAPVPTFNWPWGTKTQAGHSAVISTGAVVLGRHSRLPQGATRSLGSSIYMLESRKRHHSRDRFERRRSGRDSAMKPTPAERSRTVCDYLPQPQSRLSSPVKAVVCPVFRNTTPACLGRSWHPSRAEGA